MTRRNLLHRWADLPLEKITDMVARKTIAAGAMTLTQVYYKTGALIPLHTRATDGALYVLQGALRTTVDGDTVILREGEVCMLPGGAQYQAESLDDTFVVAFSASSTIQAIDS